MNWKPWPPQKALVDIIKRRPPRTTIIPVGGYSFQIVVDPSLPSGTVEFRYGDEVAGRIENAKP